MESSVRSDIGPIDTPMPPLWGFGLLKPSYRDAAPLALAKN
jgi:hypothetical protein